ncbi:Phosphoprotein phosphatase [Tenacibaculum sp. 190524A02b]|uniref:HAD family hydrolase n=1 Tax=Tenacibaculum vairaonense TaxID=3137860 RepID=UPI0032B29B3F
MNKKKLIILDLDETLIHATEKPIDNNWNFELFSYKVYKRPFLITFLKELIKYYRIAVWSSASDDYVHQIVSKIFPENYPLEFVWGRSKCTLELNYTSINEFGYLDYDDHLNYTKKLKKVKNKGYGNLEEILIIDDTPMKCKHNYGNAIYPKEFLGNQQDNELELLLSYLIKIHREKNFRKLEKRFWRKEI